MAYRTHRKTDAGRASGGVSNTAELWYLDTSNSTWYLSPVQPNFSKASHPVIKKTYQQISTCTLQLQDTLDGLLNPHNQNSAYNLNHSSVFDALLTQTRKMVLRTGCWCWNNIALAATTTCTLTAGGGTFTSWLTDGIMGDITTSTSNYVSYTPASLATFNINIDLGSAQLVRHAVIRFATQDTVCYLPASVQLYTSPDNVTFTPYRNAAPVGGTGSGTGGDYNDDLSGAMVEVAWTDIAASVRYLRLTVTPAIANKAIMIDEIGVYGGTAGSWLGSNRFTGYIGASTKIPNTGLVEVTLSDVTKKLADNRTTWLTARYQNQDIADVAYDLCTSTRYWTGGGAAYAAPLSGLDLGFTTGTSYTGFLLPNWQGGTNSIQGYLLEIIHLIGWNLYADGNGTLQLVNAPYSQRVPDRLFIAAPDGNNDVRSCSRTEDDQSIRNTVHVHTATNQTPDQGDTFVDAASVSLYGTRDVTIVDQQATDYSLRKEIAKKILQQYSRRTATLDVSLNPDNDTEIRKVYGFRAPLVPGLYAAASTVSGNLRAQELWQAQSLTEHVTAGDWWAEANLTPYYAPVGNPPANITWTPGATSVAVSWSFIPADATLKTVNFYLSTTNATSGFSKWAGSGAAASASPTTLTGLAATTAYWGYMTSVDYAGNESLASDVQKFTTGGSASSYTQWAITDLVVTPKYAKRLITPNSGQYLYTYTAGVNFAIPNPGVGQKIPNQYWFGWVNGAAPANPGNMASWNIIESQPYFALTPSASGPAAFDARFQSLNTSAFTSVSCVLFTRNSAASSNYTQPYASNVTTLTIPYFPYP